jgi:hypothetical protein
MRMNQLQIALLAYVALVVILSGLLAWLMRR